MELKPTSNPVGEVIESEAVIKFVENMKLLWDQTRDRLKWWQLWKRSSFTPITKFLMNALDDLISYVDQIVDTSGPDKKATVLWAIGAIYDYIIKEAMPIWMKPFAGAVRNYIINDLISTAIDWIVDKYRNGDWRPKPAEEIAAQWITMHSQMFGVPMDHRPQV